MSSPGYDRPATDDLIVGEVLGRYRVLSILQRGGMGEICLAEDLGNPGHQVVVKRVLDDLVADDAYLAMFVDEARLMARLDHPNIVRVLDTPMVRGTTCLVMEFVPGRSVAQLLRRTREDAARIPPTIALHIMAEALDGLHFAHTARDERGRPLGIVHRDVSPGNILVSFQGKVKITDFGIAKSKLSMVATSVGMVKGTTRYLSPEQIRSGDVTPRSDLFASAAVLVEMLTGVALFDRGQVPPTLLAIVKGQRKRVDEVLPFSSPELSGLLEQALALSPIHRPVNAADMAAALRRIAPTLGAPVTAAELGAYLERLFPGRTAVPVGAAATAPTGATYLVEAALNTEDLLMGTSQSGARPLDAREFEGAPPAPRSPHQPILVGRGSEPSRSLLEVDGAKARSAPDGPSGPALDVMDALEEAAQALADQSAARAEAKPVAPAPRVSAPRPPPTPPPSDPEVGVSDSAAEADAFQISAASAPAQAARAVDVRSFVLGALFGAAFAGLGVSWAINARPPPPPPPEAQAPLPAEPAAEAPTPPEPAPAAPTPPPEPVLTPTVAEAAPEEVDAGPEEAAVAPGYITITRPPGAKITVDETRYRVPMRRVEIPAGRHRVVITKRRFQREVEVELAPGQHLDLTRPEIQVVDEAPDGGASESTQ
jgi:hypothetical protein